ncbi:MAG TPA: carbohydrate ABC transporter permease [Candidatus Nitrosopolaris sp.]|nr:carbohydrate ABC transporter permease [Candidatus Nitrosopolaris sp.]
MRSLHAHRRRYAAVRVLLLVVAITGFLTPLAWTLLASFGLLPDNSTRPPSWAGSITLDHFREIGIAEPTFWQELATSTAASACAAALTIACSFLAAYGLARSRFAGEGLMVQGFLVLASLPAMAYVIPLSDLMRRAHLADTFAGIVLTEAAVTAPLAVYVLYGALRQLSPEWEEAALLDGAGLFRVLGQVVLPLAAPSVAATAIVMFVLDWNLLLVPLVLTSGEIKTIPVAMMDFFTFERELDWPTAAAALVVSLVPLAILAGVFHRALERFSLARNIR